MRRALAVAACCSLAVLASAQTFFPEGVFGEARADAFVRGWYGRHLTAMGEPSLFAMRGRGKSAIRYLRLPTWGPPVAIRVEREGARVTLVRRELDGQGGYDPGRLRWETTRALRAEDFAAITRQLRAARFFDRPTRAPLGRDGEQWIVEVVEGDRYHVVDRWTEQGTPREPELAAISALLERLAAP